ncbi:hypothetical protein ES332_A08G208600v1 [Gossypium tomentosum]|uniref:Uncharacterized protein n=1 Tax=Gossypium tomentosum TaxID=34277 RepID=A0A5D2PKC4_GOSTO|nr:hypothetical protein ES332_A08G208600v1 [Gossypium tomentosum]
MLKTHKTKKLKHIENPKTRRRKSNTSNPKTPKQTPTKSFLFSPRPSESREKRKTSFEETKMEIPKTSKLINTGGSRPTNPPLPEFQQKLAPLQPRSMVKPAVALLMLKYEPPDSHLSE